MFTKDWGIDLTGRKMWYKPWPVNKDGSYIAPDEKDIDEIYGISGEAVKETLLYFEECGGDTGRLVDMLNEHIYSDEYVITRKDLLNSDRWYTNECYFYFIMFTKKVIGRYDFHFGENSEEQLSVYHKCFEKGFLRFYPWGRSDNGSIVRDQTLGNITGPLLYLKDELEIEISDFIFFLNSILTESYKVDEDFFNNQLFWVSSEVSDYAYEFLKILSNREMFFREAVFNSAQSKLRLVRIIANVPTRYIINVFKNGTNKSNEVFNYDFNLKKDGDLIIKAELRESFNSEKFSIYRKSILLNRGIINIYGFSALISILYQLNLENIDSWITYQDNGFVISFKMDINSYNFIKIYLYSIAISVGLNLSFLYFFFMPIFLAMINFVITSILISGFLKFKILKKITETKLDEINKSSLEQMDALEKTSASLLEERNLLELKVAERTAELAEANEKLRELDKAKTDFFANISHELRTPLTLILAPVEEALSGREMKRSTLEMVRRNALDLLSLINGLLEMSRITAGKLKMKVSEINLSEILKQFCGGMESAAKLKGIELRCNAEKPVTIYADHDRLAHIISNFFSNSFKFTEPGGKIEVTVKSENNHAILEFSDTGCGIPGDKLETIFERFTQADTGSTRKYEGTGIGLSIVKELVELHGGEVSVESRCAEEDVENHGTLFTVKFPFGKEHFEERDDVEFISTGENIPVIIPHVRGIDLPRATEERMPDALYETVPAILVVEDNRDLRSLLVKMLSVSYIVHEASNGIEAVKILESTDEIDLVLSDIMMPGMDGHELLKWIRGNERLEGLPVLLLTARADLFMRIEGLDLGATDYVTKPFNSEELLLRIKNQMELKLLRNKTARNYRKLLEKLETVKTRPLGEESAAKIEAVCEFIRENYTGEFTREDLAAASGMNPDTFSRFFNQHTGKTLNDYICDLRIEEAKRRLRETGETVTRIAIDTGFDNIRTFNRVFKRLAGVAPGEFRDGLRN